MLIFVSLRYDWTSPLLNFRAFIGYKQDEREIPEQCCPTPTHFEYCNGSWRWEGSSQFWILVTILLWIFIGKYPLVPSSVLRTVATDDHISNSELAFWGPDETQGATLPCWTPVGSSESQLPHQRNFFNLCWQRSEWLKREKYLGNR